MNTYIHIDPMWSYHFFRGLNDYYGLELDLNSLNELQVIIGQYIQLRYNFVRNHIGATEYNTQQYAIERRVGELDLACHYVNHCIEHVFRTILPAMDSHPGPVLAVQPINNDSGDVVGFMVTKTLH